VARFPPRVIFEKRSRVIEELLDWLDRYLGEVR
jgi:hypothetical protein